MSEFGSESQKNRGGARRHEQTDIKLLPISLFALGLVLVNGGVLLLLGRAFWSFDAIAEKADIAQSQIFVDQKWRGPALQPNPHSDLVSFRRGEDRRLNSFGWVDRMQNVGRIPIEDAIKVLAAKGLPEPGERPKSNMERPNEQGKVQP